MTNSTNPAINPDSSEGASDYVADLDAESGTEEAAGFTADSLILLVGDGECFCGCGQAVAKGSKYRQGHDARAKGALIRAGRAGVEVVLAHGGGLVSGSAESMVDRFASTDGFVAKVLDGITRATKPSTKGAAKARKSMQESVDRLRAATESNPYGVTKATRESVSQATGEGRVSAKVGRWVYEGIVAEGEFIYTNKAGKSVIVPEGKYTVQ